MLKLRLKRMGKPHMPLYRIVVTEHTKATAGEYLEKLGNYNPSNKEVIVDKEKIVKWLNNGATPSNTVARLLDKNGIKHKLIVIKKFKARKPKSENNDSNKPKVAVSANKTEEKIEENINNQPSAESEVMANDSKNTSDSQEKLDK